MRTVTVRWPDEVTARWNALVDRISEAIKADNARKLQSAQQHKSLLDERNSLEKENKRLMVEIEEISKSVDRRDKTDFELLDRQKRQDRYRLAALIIFLATATSIAYAAWQGFLEYQQTSSSQQRQLQDLLYRELLSRRQGGVPFSSAAVAEAADSVA